MGKYLEINLVLLKEVLCFSFDMVKCLTCANIFFLPPFASFMDQACSTHGVKLFIHNELDNHTTQLEFCTWFEYISDSDK